MNGKQMKALTAAINRHTLRLLREQKRAEFIGWKIALVKEALETSK